MKNSENGVAAQLQDEGYQEVPVQTAALIADNFRKDSVVITAYDNEAKRLTITCFGVSEVGKTTANVWGQRIVKAIAGEEALAQATPQSDDFSGRDVIRYQRDIDDLVRKNGEKDRIIAELRSMLQLPDASSRIILG